ncbi:hypothetical protein Rsub_05211 [Raphidocelis subcapitata]|uniref:Haloacid dehalogenase n=1 Tax=Raphidocelis subcapitata TaxID=307507 RepID=A0A2V0P5Y9_9CHLO|nr:hypothetical protein Rsub_05211 [Raphidocelis subcapitata]|eukprot:GBF92597.1 hypothetical protein Rsub_05211 [Raphidocelis subcapitata]
MRGAADAAAMQQQQRAQRPRTVQGLGEIADSFDGVLLDQFGVLHDGRTPYPAAIDAVRRLHAAGKRVVIVSNSSRRSGGTISKLEKMGFDGGWFAGAITSGELTHRYLQQRPDDWWRALGRRCVHLTWSSRGAISLSGLGLEVVDSLEDDPDFLLAHGTEAIAAPTAAAAAAAEEGRAAPAAREESLDGLRAFLGECAAAAKRRGRRIPMIVANPDIVTVDGAGGLITMPGTLADWWARLGGEVVLMGKPGPLIYEAARDLAAGGDSAAAGGGVDASRWLAVGDSLQHDVAGWQAQGPTLFVAGGIHAEELRLEGDAFDAGALRALCEEHGAAPTHVIPWLRW